MKKYNTLVLIARSQPFHAAHLEIVRRSKVLCERLIIILGSAKQPRTFKNPFTAEERREMIYGATRGMLDGNFHITIESNTDSIYNDVQWAARVQAIVARHTGAGDAIGIIGHRKDTSSAYLDFFPQWALEEVGLIEPLNASDVRDLYFRRDANMNFIRSVVPPTVFDYLQTFSLTEEYQQVIREREFVEKYRQQYAHLPYPPIFSTADAVVIQSGHVLMIKRRAEPGRGLWALPGGYVNANTDRSVKDAAIRELREETMIKVPEPVLRGSITDSRVFDAVDRSPRGRIITHCFRIELPDGPLPKVKGSDDAEKAKWIPIAEIKSEECFEDHYDLVSWGLGGAIGG